MSELSDKDVHDIYQQVNEWKQEAKAKDDNKHMKGKIQAFGQVMNLIDEYRGTDQ